MTDSVQTPDVPLLDAVQARLLGCLVKRRRPRRTPIH